MYKKLGLKCVIVTCLASGLANSKSDGEGCFVLLPVEANLLEMTRRLYEAKIIKSPWNFFFHGLRANTIQPGYYNLRFHMPVKELLQRITQPMRYRVMIPEGYTTAEILRTLYKQSYLTGGVFSVPPEGMLFPSTFDVGFEATRASVVARMEKKMHLVLEDLWNKAGKSKALLKNKESLLILASIVEKETGIKEEHNKIATVFLNRLKLNMPLQADPTVTYALTLGQKPLRRKLTRSDTRFASPYNTYVTKGLPPAPIACPGKAALEAVLNPQDHDYLYFVADGEGGHRFAKTLQEHNNNVRLWKQQQH